MARAPRKQNPDSITPMVAAWRRERPDLDPSPVEILGRVQRLWLHMQRHAVGGWLEPLGLTWESFSLILTLRRNGPPFQLNPTDIYRESLLTSGAITNRIDRVEKAGWVRRIKDPHDRRGVLVALTPAGRKLADRAVEVHFREMARLFDDLSKAEAEQLAGLLSRLLLVFEQAPPAATALPVKSPRAGIRQRAAE